MERPKSAETELYQASPKERYVGLRLRFTSLRTAISMICSIWFVCYNHRTKLLTCFTDDFQHPVSTYIHPKLIIKSIPGLKI
jgi:hypothetical protein